MKQEKGEKKMRTIKVSGMEFEVLENGYLKLVEENGKIKGKSINLEGMVDLGYQINPPKCKVEEQDDKINLLTKYIEELRLEVKEMVKQGMTGMKKAENVKGSISADNIKIGGNTVKLNGNGTISIINGVLQSGRQITYFIDGDEFISQTENNLYIRNK